MDLPEPLGPMMAWVSPARTVRSTPRRISLAPAVGVDGDVQVADLKGGHASAPVLVGRIRRRRRGRCRPRRDGVDGDGVMAGGPVGSPVRRSKREPCSQHSMVQPSTSPSDSETSACEQMSSTARTRLVGAHDGDRGWPLDLDARRAPTAGSSSSRQTRTKPVSVSSLEPAPRRRPSAIDRGELALDGGHEPLLRPRARRSGRRRRRRSRARPAGGPRPRGCRGLQVEQLLVVEPAGGAGVPGADDLAGLDLEVRHRVGARAVGEHQVAVELVGVGALGARRGSARRRSRPCARPRPAARPCSRRRCGSAARRGRRRAGARGAGPASAK